MLWKILSPKFLESLDSGPLKMGPIGRTETSAQNYRYSLRNSSVRRTSLILRGGSLKSCMCLICPRFHVFLSFFLSLLPSFQHSFGSSKRYIAQTNVTKRVFRKTHISHTLTKKFQNIELLFRRHTSVCLLLCRIRGSTGANYTTFWFLQCDNVQFGITFIHWVGRPSKALLDYLSTKLHQVGSRKRTLLTLTIILNAKSKRLYPSTRQISWLVP